MCFSHNEDQKRQLKTLNKFWTMSAIEMHKHLSNKVIFNITNLIEFDVS